MFSVQSKSCLNVLPLLLRVAFTLAFVFTGVVGTYAEAATRLPDLIVSAVSAPSTAQPGQSFVLSASIKNQGRASASTVQAAFYLTKSASSITGATLLGTQNVGSLSAGAVLALTATLSIPSSTSPGTFYVATVADPTKIIKESKETNNTRASGAIAVKDLTPPTISAVNAAQITASNATITWTTDKTSTSQADYGTTAAYGSSTSPDSSLVTSHGVTLSGLTAGKAYHFRVQSKDASGNAALSTDYTFTTATATTGLTDSPPLTIAGQTGITIRGLRITNPSGPCIRISSSSSNIVIQDSDIGPCGGNAVEITDSSAIKVVNSSIHTEHDGSKVGNSGLGVLVYNSTGILVQGNTFAYNESSVYALDSSDIQVIGNYSVNPLGPGPRGQHVQFDKVQGGMINENYGISSGDTALYKYPAHQEDAINVWSSAFIEVRANYLVGGDSPSGCGVIADGSGNANTLVNNVVIRTGQCGIAIAGGTNHVIAGNKVLDTNIPTGSGNIGIYVWNQYSGPCSGHSVTGNDVSNLLPDGSYNNYWISGNCGPVTLLDNLGGSDARALLTPEAEKLPAPPIPPKPYVL